MKEFADGFPSRVDEYENLLTGNPIWIDAHKGRRLHLSSKT